MSARDGDEGEIERSTSVEKDRVHTSCIAEKEALRSLLLQKNGVRRGLPRELVWVFLLSLSRTEDATLSIHGLGLESMQKGP